MQPTRVVTRRSVLAGTAGLLATPAIIGRAAAATRGVSDTEIIIGTITSIQPERIKESVPSKSNRTTRA